MKHLLTLTLIQLVLVCSAFSQGILDNLQIGGNFQSDSYYYLRDSTIESAVTKILYWDMTPASKALELLIARFPTKTIGLA